MSALEDLYQEIILDHYRSPRNQHAVAGASHAAVGHNPLCGDRIELEVRLDGDRIADVGFRGSGCAISTASASMMTEEIKGLPLAEVEALIEEFRRLLTGEEGEVSPDSLGRLGALAGVRRIPIRVKCATLAWHTLRNAIAGSERITTTEEQNSP